jgi:hypothetical protein
MDLPAHRPGITFKGLDKRLIAYAIRNGLMVTSTRGGRHNAGSKHYRGKALDFSIHKSNGELISEDYIEHLNRDAKENGMLLLDERERLPGEKIWHGSHFHLEILNGA